MDSPETSIDQLAALQDVDRRLREKVTLADALEAEAAELESQLLQQRETTRAVQAERDTVEARRRELEAHLADEEAKMTDRRMRLNRVRNEKELQALRREIEVGKEANQQIEEELLGILESSEKLSAAAAEAEAKLAEMEAAVAKEVSERRARSQQALRTIAADKEARDRLAAALDLPLRQKYEQISKRHSGTVVVEVRNGTCQGCHMHLPPQFFNELQRTREVRMCPNCHRILFWRPDRLESADTPR